MQHAERISKPGIGITGKAVLRNGSRHNIGDAIKTTESILSAVFNQDLVDCNLMLDALKAAYETNLEYKGRGIDRLKDAGILDTDGEITAIAADVLKSLYRPDDFFRCADAYDAFSEPWRIKQMTANASERQR